MFRWELPWTEKGKPEFGSDQVLMEAGLFIMTVGVTRQSFLAVLVASRHHSSLWLELSQIFENARRISRSSVCRCHCVRSQWYKSLSAKHAHIITISQIWGHFLRFSKMCCSVVSFLILYITFYVFQKNSKHIVSDFQLAEERFVAYKVLISPS